MFWADVDTRGTGDVWYHQSNDAVLFDRANTEIRTAFPYQASFNVTQIYIFTWEEVGYFDRVSAQVSFQYHCSCVCVKYSLIITYLSLDL